MTTPKQPEFEIGEAVYVSGMHRNYKPRIVSIEHGCATVKSDSLPGSERTFRLADLEKISTTTKRGK